MAVRFRGWWVRAGPACAAPRPRNPPPPLLLSPLALPARHAGIPSPFSAVRYHSLAGRPETLPACLEVTCRTASGIIQGVRHIDPAVRLEGVQFHPESILTQYGKELLANFLRWGGIAVRPVAPAVAGGGCGGGGGGGAGSAPGAPPVR